MVFLIQMAMLFAGIATLFQTVGFGPVGARLPVMQGTSFAVPIMIGVNPIFAWRSDGIDHRDRRLSCSPWYSDRTDPALVPATGVWHGDHCRPVSDTCWYSLCRWRSADFQVNNPNWGDFSHWSLALVVIIVALGCKFFTRGLTSSAAILLGLIAGYLVGIATGAVNFGAVAKRHGLPFRCRCNMASNSTWQPSSACV